jgi:hypothetical protein
MTGFLGQTEQLSNVTPEAGAGSIELLKMLQQMGLLKGLFGGQDEGIPPEIQASFDLANEQAFAQAKESVGTLTGSSLGGVLGREAGNAATQQGIFKTQFAEQRRAGDQNRFLQSLQLALGGPAAGVSNFYRPGFLDSLSQGAIGLAQGGAFNPLFNSGGGGNA